MLAILSIIIGIVFVLLLFSMLTSAVVEVFHAAFSSRGKHLRETLEIMLGKEVCAQFYTHAYFRQLSSASKPRSNLKLPIWIEKGTFSSVLADVLTPEDSDLSIPERIKLVKNDNLRKVLDFLWRQSKDDVLVFQKKVEEWFADVMARAKGWFADATKWRLFFIGVALAGILNADTLQIYKSLSANAALRDELVKDAEDFTNAHDSVPQGPDTSKTSVQANADFKATKQLYVETVQSPLGLGWGTASSIPNNLWDWLIKFVGWVLTGVAVTLGAPFWYDLLRKLISFKSGASGESKNNADPTGNDGKSTVKPVSPFDMKAAESEPAAG